MRRLVRTIRRLGGSALRLLSASLICNTRLLSSAGLVPITRLVPITSLLPSASRALVRRLPPVVTVERLHRFGVGLALVVLGVQGRIILRCVNPGPLLGGGRDTLCLRGGLFLLGRFGFRTSRAIKASPAADVLVHDLPIHVSVVNHRGIHPAHGRVIAENSPRPLAAIVTVPDVAVAIIDPPVKTDCRAPVAIVEDVAATAIAPVAGRPEKTDLRWVDPDARDPVIAKIAVGPIARRPDITGTRAYGCV